MMPAEFLDYGPPSPLFAVGTDIPGSATDYQQEMGNKLHWPVRPIQHIIPFPVVILWPNRVEYIILCSPNNFVQSLCDKDTNSPNL